MADEPQSSQPMEVEQAADVFTGILAREKPAPAAAKPEPKRAAPQQPRAAPPEPAPEKVEEPDNRESDDADEVQIDDDGPETDGDNAAQFDVPKSMPAEYRETFAKLPADLQKFLVDRERDAAKGGEKITGKAKADQEAAQSAKRQYETALQQLSQLSARHRDPDIVRFETDFKDVLDGTTDPVKLAEEDLGRYLQFTAARDKAGAAFQREQATGQAAQQQARESLVKFRQEENDRLKELIPAFKDEKKFAEADNKITQALRGIGIPDEQILGASAKALALAYDGIRYREAVAKAKAGEARIAPTVQKPGTSERRNGKAEGVAVDMNRLKKSGRPEDAARVFTRLLGG